MKILSKKKSSYNTVSSNKLMIISKIIKTKLITYVFDALMYSSIQR